MSDTIRQEIRIRLERALSSSLADAYDCNRVWSAWGYGTMDENDFVPVLDRLDEIVDEIIESLSTQ